MGLRDKESKLSINPPYRVRLVGSDRYEAAPSSRAAFQVAQDMFSRYGSAINITGMVWRNNAQEEIVWGHVTRDGEVSWYAEEA